VHHVCALICGANHYPSIVLDLNCQTTTHHLSICMFNIVCATCELHYGDGMGYMRVLERGFAEHVRHAIRLSYLRFFSKLSIQVVTMFEEIQVQLISNIYP